VRIVSAAALIMFSIFVAFMTTKAIDIRVIAFSFAVGVALDAFVVRLTLVPAVMAIVGAKMRYHPRWFARYVPDAGHPLTITVSGRGAAPCRGAPRSARRRTGPRCR
jgi:uncharacterized membrane protein YdfJ with MMPL/SSD domain